MNISKVWDVFVNYNPISLSLDGITFLLKKASIEMRTFALFFSVIPSLAAYFVRRLAEDSTVSTLLPRFIMILSPLECGFLTFAIIFLQLCIFFGAMSKNPSMQSIISESDRHFFISNLRV